MNFKLNFLYEYKDKKTAEKSNAKPIKPISNMIEEKKLCGLTAEISQNKEDSTL